jgi:hypothetical protein
MGFFTREPENSESIKVIQRKLLDFDTKFYEVTAELNFIKKELKSLDIRVDEAKEKYAKKLKKLVSREDEENEAGNLDESEEYTPTGEKILK